MQYELDGASEAHDPSQPSTNTCPYLPGQTVNTLWIPVEQSLRKRSASLTSLREEDFKTMDPASKYVTPRPAPAPPSEPARRLGTAPLRMQQKRPARSPSPSSRWFSPRKLFSRKSSSSSLNTQTSQTEDERSLRSEGSRSRDISPESLRRFLVDDAPLDHDHEDTINRPAIHIPEDIVEENEDDDNFATSAISETMQFTGLSPPPPRAASPAMTITALAPTPPKRTTPPRLPTLLYTAPHATLQPELPQSPDDAHSLPGFDLSSDDDEYDDDEEEEEEADDLIAAQQPNPFARNLTAALSTYSLPRTAGTDGGKLTARGPQQQPAAVAAAGAGAGGVVVPSSLVLSSPIPDGGLGELVNELGWMAGLIRGEYA
jgi:hypothetical protein